LESLSPETYTDEVRGQIAERAAKWESSMTKSAINAAILFSTSVLAHLFAGGEFATGLRLFLYGVFIYLFLLLIGPGDLNGPKLALVSLVSQSLTHVTLGAMSGSSYLMTYSHLIGGYIGYFAVSRAEEFWQNFTSILTRVLIQLKILLIPKYKNSNKIQFSYFRTINFVITNDSNGLRAPPALIKILGSFYAHA